MLQSICLFTTYTSLNNHSHGYNLQYKDLPICERKTSKNQIRPDSGSAVVATRRLEVVVGLLPSLGAHALDLLAGPKESLVTRGQSTLQRRPERP